MKTTTYICDKCKASVGKDDLVEISFSASFIQTPNGYKQNQRVNKDVCKNCLKDKGLMLEFDPEKHEQDLKKNEKTMEDKLLEILEDLGVMFQE